MKKPLFLLLILTICFSTSFAQQNNIGINTSTPDPSAALHVYATDKGMLIPRMNSSQRNNILNAAVGLLVFDTDTESFWYRENTKWVELGNHTWEKNGNDLYYNQGNVGIGVINPSHTFEVVTEVLEPTLLDVEQDIIGDGGLHIGGDLWQSFTAGISGNLTELETYLYQGPWSGTLYIYEGEGTGGNLLHSQPYDMIGQAWQTFSLNTPVRVNSGWKYTFRLSNSKWFLSNDDDPYPGGQSSFSSTVDFNFRTYISEAIPSTTIVVSENRVGIAKVNPQEVLDVGGNVKANTFLGDGSQLTGIYIDDADADPTNEIQNWSNLPGIPPNIDIDATDDFSGSYLDLTDIPIDIADGDAVDDADADPTNELQSWSNLPGIPPNIDIDATDDFSGSYLDLTDVPIDIDDGDAVDDADPDPTNELQMLSKDGSNITLSHDGGTISVADNDNDSTNELELPANPQAGDITYYDGNSWQLLPIGPSRHILSITNGFALIKN